MCIHTHTLAHEQLSHSMRKRSQIGVAAAEVDVHSRATTFMYVQPRNLLQMIANNRSFAECRHATSTNQNVGILRTVAGAMGSVS